MEENDSEMDASVYESELEHAIELKDIIEHTWDAINWHIHENPKMGEDEIIKMDWVGDEYMSRVTISGETSGVQAIVKEFVKDGWHAERDHSRDIFTAIVTPQ